VNKTSIPWVTGPDGKPGFSWNPLLGCKALSPGCANCYAARLAGTRLAHLPQYADLASESNRTTSGVEFQWTGEVRFFPERLAEPLRLRKPSGIFCCDMSDLFHESVTNEQIAAVFGVMAATPQHRYFALTKRSRRRRALMSDPDFIAEVERAFQRRIDSESSGHRGASHRRDGKSLEGEEKNGWKGYPSAGAEKLQAQKSGSGGGTSDIGNLPKANLEARLNWPLPNVFQGSTICTQAEADRDIPELLRTPAALRFLSCEPLLEAIRVDYEPLYDGATLSLAPGLKFPKDFEIGGPPPMLGIDWVIVGGESGPRARPCNVDWIRSIVQQCNDAGVACFVKQMGANAFASVNDLEVAAGLFPSDMGQRGRNPEPLRLRDRAGADPAEWPEDLRVRQLPEFRR
jgi:protein gp37